MESLLEMEHPAGYQVKFVRGGGWCNARRRINSCEIAIASGAKYLVMLDADQTYPKDILLKFVKHMEEGKDMVAAMVPQRGYRAGTGMKPFQRLAWKSNDNETTIPVLPEDGDVQPCIMPTCAALICRSKDLSRLSQPWFRDQFNPETMEREFAEDLYFTMHIQKELGLQAWVDTTIEVKHLHLFSIDGTFVDRFEDWAEQGKGDPEICTYKPRTKKFIRKSGIAAAPGLLHGVGAMAWHR